MPTSTPTAETPAIELRDVGRRFGAVQALIDVTLAVNAGEIVALVGDNGAGKTTLMSIICGAQLPDHGDVVIGGERVNGLRHAQRLGVGSVHQDLALAPHLSVIDNMFLGREPRAPGVRGALRWLDRRRMAREARQAIAELGIVTLHDVEMPVSRLSGGQRQVVAVARAMMWTRSVVLLDEPTAALGPKQVGIVLDAIRQAAAAGRAVIIVSHDIPAMLELAHRIVVLRRGSIVADLDPGGLTVANVVGRMVGENHPTGPGPKELP